MRDAGLPFDDSRRGTPFRRSLLLLHHVVTHPVSNHAFYPLASQNQHDCKQMQIPADLRDHLCHILLVVKNKNCNRVTPGT